MPNTNTIKTFARSIGVDLIGITQAVFDEEGEKHLRDFIDEKRSGDMHYLEDYQKRVDPQTLLPGAKSVIVIGINYYREVPETPKDHGRIARYAYGRDYHKVLKKLLKQIVHFIQAQAPNSQSKICVDSAPILEKSYAQKAGLGFIGKNTTLITPEFGSWILLGEILTTLSLEYDQGQIGSPNGSSEANRLGQVYGANKWVSSVPQSELYKKRAAGGTSNNPDVVEMRKVEPGKGQGRGTCGTCTRCMDACPTKAITAAGRLDATRCISYLTIEKKGDIPKEFHKPMGNLIFGCDICQEVCPYNIKFARPLQLEAFKKIKIAGSSIPLQEILDIQTDEEFLERFAGSPIMRTKRKGLQRNARIVTVNLNIF